jgi:RHS repeat-associated protein
MRVDMSTITSSDYRARYYEPAVGRFLSEDPIRFRGGIDFYKYVDNRPLDFFDPYGLQQAWNTKKPPRPGKLRGGGAIIYGFWCGPDYTGGLNESYDPADEWQYQGPIDQLDMACRRHDICYYNCRQQHKCDGPGRKKCMTGCNRILGAEAEAADFDVRSKALIAGYMKKFDAQEEKDPPCCKDKKK